MGVFILYIIPQICYNRLSIDPLLEGRLCLRNRLGPSSQNTRLMTNLLVSGALDLCPCTTMVWFALHTDYRTSFSWSALLAWTVTVLIYSLLRCFLSPFFSFETSLQHALQRPKNTHWAWKFMVFFHFDDDSYPAALPSNALIELRLCLFLQGHHDEDFCYRIENLILLVIFMTSGSDVNDPLLCHSGVVIRGESRGCQLWLYREELCLLALISKWFRCILTT